MRKNNTYTVCIPETRNEFIDCVQGKKEAIIIKSTLLIELDEELKSNQNKGTAKKVLTTAGVTGLLVLNLYNPLVWVLGVGSLLAGGLLKNDIKGYAVHKATDMEGKDILILVHKKKVNKKYDTIVFDKDAIFDEKNLEFFGMNINKIINTN